LIELLEKASETVKVLVVDPGLNEGDKKFLDLQQVIVGMTTMWDRIRRLFSSGLDSVMIQYHDVSGRRAMTMLGSGGDYAALLPPDGKLYRGMTRELALAALLEGEGLRRTKDDSIG
jgi:hypothetical protein